MRELDHRLSVVTGASTGLGKACAIDLARRGSRVVLLDRDLPRLESVLGLLAGPQDHVALDCDVSSSTAVQRAFARIAQAMGPVDVLVNCAGVNAAERHFGELRTDTWDQVVGVNLSGTYYCCQAALDSMRRQRRGTIVNLSSWAGRHAMYFTGPAYNASKRAVLALTESINIEEGPNNIRATAVVPEAIATEMLRNSPGRPGDDELDRLLAPEDVATLIGTIVCMPDRACVNEVVISPVWNRSYLGVYETANARQDAPPLHPAPPHRIVS